MHFLHAHYRGRQFIAPLFSGLQALSGRPYDAYYKQNLFPACFANGLPLSEAKVLASTQEPLATIALSQPSGVPAWKTIPSWAVVGTADRVILPAIQLAMARHAHAHITEVKAPHLSMIAAPGVVTQVILKAVHATG